MAAKITNIRTCCALLNFRFCTGNIASFSHRVLFSSPYVQAKVLFCSDLYSNTVLQYIILHIIKFSRPFIVLKIDQRSDVLITFSYHLHCQPSLYFYRTVHGNHLPSSQATNNKEKPQNTNSLRILKSMLHHVWPKDRNDLKIRVVLAISLLVGSKVKFSSPKISFTFAL